jgi:hypothetical protein
MDGSTAYRMSKAVLLRDADSVAFHRETGCVVTLNQSGYLVLLHFLERSTVDATADSMSSIFDLDQGTAKAHVIEIVRMLEEYQIVERDCP